MTIYSRMAAASATGLPSGAAVDVAKATTSDTQAGQAGQLFAARNPFGAVNAMSATPAPSDAQAGWNAGLVRALNNTNTYLATGMTWAGYGLRAVKDYYTAAIRAPQVTAAQARQKGGIQANLGGLFGGLEALVGLVPGAGFAFPEFRRQWGTVTRSALPQGGRVSGAGSLGQTFLAPFHDPNPGNANPYDFLDDPKFAQPGPVDPETGNPTPSERDLYFSSGVARWMSGLIDATADMTLDPLIVGGKAAGIARAVHNAVVVADVAKAAEAAAAGVRATGKASRIQTWTTRVIEASERVRDQQAVGVAGGHAALTGSLRKQGLTDAGAMSAYLRAADRIVDPTARVQAKALGVYAGLGDPKSLSVLRQRHGVLAQQLEVLAGPDHASEIDALLLRGDRTFAQNLAAVDSDESMARLVAIYDPQIKAELAASDRIDRLGSAGTSLTGLRLTETNGRAFTQVARTVRTADNLPSIHVVGRALSIHAPKVIDYADAGFLAKLTAHVADSRSLLGAGPEVDQTLGTFLDRAALAHGSLDIAAAKAELKSVVDDYKGFMANHVAAKLVGVQVGQKMTRATRLKFEQARGLVTDGLTKRDESLANLGLNAQRVSNDAAYIATQDAHGAIAVVDKSMAIPFSPTQWEQSAILTDYQHLYNKLAGKIGGNPVGWVRQGATGAWELSQVGLDLFSDLWKFGTLFRAGYAVRTQVDTQFRRVITQGPLMWVAQLAHGGMDIAANARTITIEQRDWAQQVWGARQRQSMIALEFPDQYLTGTLPKEVQAEWNALETAAGQKMPKALAGAQKVRVEDTALARFVGKPTLTRSGEIKGDMATAAFQSIADRTRQLATVSSESSVLELMTSSYQEGLAMVRTGHFQSITTKDPAWGKAWADYVNRHVRSDKIGGTLLARWDSPSVDGELAAWLKGAQGVPERDVGLAVWNEVSTKWPGAYEGPEDLVAFVREQVAEMLPTPEARALASTRDLAVKGKDKIAADVAAVWGKSADQPAIPWNMPITAPRMATRQALALRKFQSDYFKLFGSMPENSWARNPFYADRKASYMRSALGDARAQGGSITVDAYNQIAKRAAALAKQDVSRYLFDTSQRSNLGHSLRYLSPFYGAWSDTMRKWALIVGEHPESIGIGAQVSTAPRRIFTVVDGAGNTIRPDGTKVDPTGAVVGRTANPFDGYAVVPLPSWLQNLHIPGLGSADPASGVSVRLPLSALNLIFQGDPFWLPGPGPVATIPVNELARRSFPEVWDDQSPAGAALRYLLPYGLDANSASEAVPAWLQNLSIALGAHGGVLGSAGDSYAQTSASLLAEETNAEELGLRPKLSQGQLYDLIANRTRNWYVLRFMGSESGLNAQPTTRLDYWRDEYQRYRRTFPNATRTEGDGSQTSAEQAFYQDHPDYFDATLSLAVNETGIAATDESWAPTKKYLPDIQADPSHGWIYVGAANLAPGFDSGVYTAQKSLGLRSQQDPETAYKQMKESEGWMDWNSINGQVQTILADRGAAGGSASINAKSNSDLASIRSNYKNWLVAKNPQWANAYESGSGGGNANGFLRAAAGALQAHPDLLDRPDFQLLEDYMQIREQVQTTLESRGLSQISSKGAEDLQDIVASWTAWAVNKDLGFQQMYNRGDLERDTFSSAPVSVPKVGE